MSKRADSGRGHRNAVARDENNEAYANENFSCASVICESDGDVAHKAAIHSVERLLTMMREAGMSPSDTERMEKNYGTMLQWLRDRGGPNGATLAPAIERTVDAWIYKFALCKRIGAVPFLPTPTLGWKPKKTFRRPKAKDNWAPFLNGDTSGLPLKPPRKA